MGSSKWPDGVMVKARRRPCILSMAADTICWEIITTVVGVGRGIKIRLMAAYTCIRRIIEVTVVTGITVVCDTNMCSSNRPN